MSNFKIWSANLKEIFKEIPNFETQEDIEMVEAPSLQKVAESELAKKIEFADDVFEEDEKLDPDSLKGLIDSFNWEVSNQERFGIFETIISKWIDDLKNPLKFKSAVT